jgi:hypothetical protein
MKFSNNRFITSKYFAMALGYSIVQILFLMLVVLDIINGVEDLALWIVSFAIFLTSLATISKRDLEENPI